MEQRRFGLRSLARVFLPIFIALAVIAPALVNTGNQASAAASLHYLFGSGSATGGKTVNFRIELTEPAPSGGAVVTLATSHPAIPLPPTVTVSAGQTERSFGVGSIPVMTNTNVTVSATYLGVTKSRVVLIKEPILSSLSVQTKMRAGGAGKIIARLSGRAPIGGVVVNVVSSNPAVVASPGNQTVVAGAASVTIIVNPTFQEPDVPVDFTATYDGVTITRSTIVRWYPDTAATATAGAIETMTAVVDQTNTAVANQTATEIANQTATADANNTATEAANQTATANANASATEAANQTATQGAIETATEAAVQTATEAANQTSTALANEATQTSIANDITQTAIAVENDMTATQVAAEAQQTQTAQANEATGTAVANETATESANQTATADANNTATEAANQTATADANNTATEAANQTATADANASATEAANQTATADANNTATEAANQTATADANNAATEAANQTATADANNTATEAANQTATADANGTATEAANQTATADANATGTAQADATGTAAVIQTATAAANATGTAQANATGTAQANATATSVAATATAVAQPGYTATWNTSGPVGNGQTVTVTVCANNIPSPQWVTFSTDGGGFGWPSLDDLVHNFGSGTHCIEVDVTNNSGGASGQIVFEVHTFPGGTLLVSTPPRQFD